MKIRIYRITWNYGRSPFGDVLHLIRLKNGAGLLRTTEWCRRRGLCR